VLWKQPFQDSVRTVPITFNAPEHIRMKYTIDLPRQVDLPDLPQDNMQRMNGAYLIESYDHSNHQLLYQFDISLQHSQYPSTRYHDLRTLYGRWVELSQTRWMLNKK
jgi:hypothetical protein